MKTFEECQITGYKLLKQCNYYNDKIIVDEELFNESCLESKKLGSLYVFLIIAIIFTIIFS